MSLLGALVDLVLPRCCIGCGSVLGPLCPLCRPSGSVFEAAAGTWAATPYDGPARAALLAYKERSRRDLAGPLGELLADAVRAALDSRPGPGPPGSGRPRPATPTRAGRTLLVPVPSARAAVANRGGDHVLRLGRRAAAVTGLPVARDALALTRTVRDSAGLDSGQRSANLAEAMRARPAPAGCSALLVDDIVTTGATLREAGRALQAAGWSVIGHAVVAATPRRFPRRVANPIGSSQSHGLA